MQYVLLIYDEENSGPEPDTAEAGARWSAHLHFGNAIARRGALVEGRPLHPTTTATTIRVRDDVTLTTDGPFEATRSQLSGYYVIEVDDIDDAIAVAATLPGARAGCVEVRPVMEVP